MVRGEALFEGVTEAREMQRLQVVMRQLAFDHLIDDAADAQRLVVACKAQAGVKALVDRLVAAVA